MLPLDITPLCEQGTLVLVLNKGKLLPRQIFSFLTNVSDTIQFSSLLPPRVP